MLEQGSIGVVDGQPELITSVPMVVLDCTGKKSNRDVSADIQSNERTWHGLMRVNIDEGPCDFWN